MSNDLALAVKAAAVEVLEEREEEHLIELLESAEDLHGYSRGDLKALDLDALRHMYTRSDVAYEIWEKKASTSTHLEDNYYRGFQAGAAMVLEHLERVSEAELKWPHDDVVALGVLQTVSDRRGDGATAWAESIGRNRFYAILGGDNLHEVESYFVALDENNENVLENADYDRRIGPAVDRVEDAYADTADV